MWGSPGNAHVAACRDCADPEFAVAPRTDAESTRGRDDGQGHEGLDPRRVVRDDRLASCIRHESCCGADLLLDDAGGHLDSSSRTRWVFDVAGGLNVDRQPTVVAADARHVSSVAGQLHEDGRIRFRERVQIGRSDEREGFWSGPLWADRHDRPLLRRRAEPGGRRRTRRATCQHQRVPLSCRYFRCSDRSFGGGCGRRAIAPRWFNYRVAVSVAALRATASSPATKRSWRSQRSWRL